jgi:hypothetical protein
MKTVVSAPWTVPYISQPSAAPPMSPTRVTKKEP